nr:hypothetical protein HK105_005780 [Polyrhizophydium stewartii]
MDDHEYERERQSRIRENNRHLLELGLISEVNPEGQDDAAYLRSLLSAPLIQESAGGGMAEPPSPSTVFVPHLNIPATALLEDGPWIAQYRALLVHIALNAAARMSRDALFVVGVKDVRVRLSDEDVRRLAGDMILDPELLGLCARLSGMSLRDDRDGIDDDSQASGTAPDDAGFALPTRLVPLSLLVLEDLVATTSHVLQLKEFTAVVPDGYARDKGADVDELKTRLSEDDDEWGTEKRGERAGRIGTRRVLPIVHAQYFIFQRR